MRSETICFVTTSNTLKYWYSAFFLLHSFLVINFHCSYSHIVFDIFFALFFNYLIFFQKGLFGKCKLYKQKLLNNYFISSLSSTLEGSLLRQALTSDVENTLRKDDFQQINSFENVRGEDIAIDLKKRLIQVFFVQRIFPNFFGNM